MGIIHGFLNKKSVDNLPSPVGIESTDLPNIGGPVHIEDFTRARVNESYLTAVLVETGAMPVRPD